MEILALRMTAEEAEALSDLLFVAVTDSP